MIIKAGKCYCTTQRGPTEETRLLLLQSSALINRMNQSDNISVSLKCFHGVLDRRKVLVENMTISKEDNSNKSRGLFSFLSHLFNVSLPCELAVYFAMSQLA